MDIIDTDKILASLPPSAYRSYEPEELETAAIVDESEYHEILRLVEHGNLTEEAGLEALGMTCSDQGGIEHAVGIKEMGVCPYCGEES
jgi:hypothetical protein